MSDGSPTDVVVAYFDALDRGAWAEAVALIDPAQVTAYRDECLAQIIAWLRYRKLNPRPSGFSSERSVSPEAIAQHAQEAVPPYGPGVTVGSLAALPPAAFMANDFEVGDRTGSAPGFGRLHGSRMRRKILGELPYNYEHVYVAYVRGSQDDSALDNPWALPHVETMPVRRRGKRWYLGANLETRMMGPQISLADEP